MAFQREKMTGSVNAGLFTYGAGQDSKTDLQVGGYFGNSVSDGKIFHTDDLVIATCSDGVGLFLVTDDGGDTNVTLEME